MFFGHFVVSLLIGVAGSYRGDFYPLVSSVSERAPATLSAHVLIINEKPYLDITPDRGEFQVHKLEHNPPSISTIYVFE